MKFASLCILLSLGVIFAEYNNLQVLNFKSDRDLKKYMKSIGKDLGVKCSFCHDLNDKSIDTDHKIIAREMIRMQQDLNKNYFAQIGDSLLKSENTLQISCWTCHKGSIHPESYRSEE